MPTYKFKLSGVKMFYGELEVTDESYEKAVDLARYVFKEENECDTVYVTDVREDVREEVE